MLRISNITIQELSAELFSLEIQLFSEDDPKEKEKIEKRIKEIKKMIED